MGCWISEMAVSEYRWLRAPGGRVTEIVRERGEATGPILSTSMPTRDRKDCHLERNEPRFPHTPLPHHVRLPQASPGLLQHWFSMVTPSIPWIQKCNTVVSCLFYKTKPTTIPPMSPNGIPDSMMASPTGPYKPKLHQPNIETCLSKWNLNISKSFQNLYCHEWCQQIIQAVKNSSCD